MGTKTFARLEQETARYDWYDDIRSVFPWGLKVAERDGDYWAELRFLWEFEAVAVLARALDTPWPHSRPAFAATVEEVTRDLIAPHFVIPDQTELRLSRTSFGPDLTTIDVSYWPGRTSLYVSDGGSYSGNNRPLGAFKTVRTLAQAGYPFWSAAKLERMG